MDISDILKRVEPIGFDGCTPKSKFLKILNVFPELRKELENKLLLDINQEWVQKAKNEKFYFLIYDDSWKILRASSHNSLSLNFIGMNYIPVISIDIHERLV